MMRKGGETPEEEKARFKVSRGFAKRVKEILGDAPDIVFEHVGKATFPTSVFTVKPFGKVVICAGTTGYRPRLRRRATCGCARRRSSARTSPTRTSA